MRRFVVTVVSSLMIAGLAGCTAKASLSAGASSPPPRAVPAPPAAPPPPAAPAAAKPEKKFEMQGPALKLPGPVVFETGSDKLKPESDEVLAIVVDYLTAKPNISLLRIEGHTDTDGKADTNQTLSEKRSMSVARWLTGKGIKCDRLIPVGFGQTKPIADNATPDGKAQNRRTSFVNAGLNGKAIGGFPVDGGGHVAGDPCK